MHQIDIKVRGYHLDLYGHVNNARYLEFLEEARWAYFDDEADLVAYMHEGFAFVVVNINISYRRPALMNEVLTLDTSMHEVGHRSAVIRQVVRHKESGAVVAEADVTFVLYRERDKRAIVIDGELRALLERLSARDRAAGPDCK
ncbi:acyl-CoA thioesterase [Laribacter hongkongensis]|uniref:acyl-CoA thioesterase n=1 Tax=Laribacter hongkongensis TaxID=168471 RepID=UPI001EFCABA7|nr:thioesterase family protein [Laribacter hongkongensis]MCG8996320.1 acyl-CoA thioesterase [Laribacter hongkongensis]MCG9011255.1 acyl-CoA thioesterase [Laribacter hongkongensis]MCG9023405.1 acyl-CoA thioesterase [Laribacter hongkongensis]MCG9047632.1 acyl-CoA thioesterase [Laribacter hongkongensis]MCG9074206.1 acyl-CoA thioesterase [Laribacter hongkongensis]